MSDRGPGAAALTRGRPCRKCGADKWRRRPNKRSPKGWTWACRGCDGRRVRRNNLKVRKDVARSLWYSAKQRARRKGLTFDITVDQVRALLVEQCPVLGIPLSAGKDVQHDGSPSLDRLNSAWGYEVGNVAVISTRANRAKNSLSAAEHERIAAWMRSHGLG